MSDTGIGIAPEDLPRIFDKGFTGLQRPCGQKVYRAWAVFMQAGGRQALYPYSYSLKGGRRDNRILDLRSAELEIE